MDIVDPLIGRAHHLANAVVAATKDPEVPRTRPEAKRVFEEIEPLVLELAQIVVLGKLTR